MTPQEEMNIILFGQDRVRKEVIMQAKKRKNVIYGAQSLNKQTSGFINRPTNDYDVYSRRPSRDARELEKNLDRAFGGDFFMTKPALHPGTTKVVMNQSQRGVADFTRPPVGLKTRRVSGVLYSSLGHEAMNRLKSLRDPESSFRHKKDSLDLDRIRLQRRLARLG